MFLVQENYSSGQAHKPIVGVLPDGNLHAVQSFHHTAQSASNFQQPNSTTTKLVSFTFFCDLHVVLTRNYTTIEKFSMYEYLPFGALRNLKRKFTVDLRQEQEHLIRLDFLLTDVDNF